MYNINDLGLSWKPCANMLKLNGVQDSSPHTWSGRCACHWIYAWDGEDDSGETIAKKEGADKRTWIEENGTQTYHANQSCSDCSSKSLCWFALCRASSLAAETVMASGARTDGSKDSMDVFALCWIAKVEISHQLVMFLDVFGHIDASRWYQLTFRNHCHCHWSSFWRKRHQSKMWFEKCTLMQLQNNSNQTGKLTETQRPKSFARLVRW